MPIYQQKLPSAIEQYGKKPMPFTNHKRISIQMPEGLEEIVPNYLQNRKLEVPQLLQLLAASDFERIRILGHNLKGSGSGYGFPQLTEIGAELERSARDASTDRVIRQLRGLEEYLDRVQLQPTK